MNEPQDDRAERPPAILVIDTSSAQGGIALSDGETLSQRSWPAGRSHTTTLLREIHHLLDASEREVKELAAIGIAAGPGAFTGLRAGFGVAKGFHLAAGLPLIGVSTLAAAALPFATGGQPIVAAIAAGRGRLVWAWFAPEASALVQERPPRNGSIADLAAEVTGNAPVLVTGELDDEQERHLAAIAGVIVPPRLLRVRQPGALATLAWRRWQAGTTDNPETLEPVYLSR